MIQKRRENEATLRLAIESQVRLGMRDRDEELFRDRTEQSAIFEVGLPFTGEIWVHLVFPIVMHSPTAQNTCGSQSVKRQSAVEKSSLR